MALSKTSRLILATNGLSKVQNSRIQNLRSYFEKCFISEEIGYIKPSREFFDYLLHELKANPKECLMIGDSITSDILGAHNVDIDTCWYNQNGKVNKYGIKPTYEIKSLRDLILLTA
jgi:HAD superfamily hydrolase (TIGR01509 family)